MNKHPSEQWIFFTDGRKIQASETVELDIEELERQYAPATIAFITNPEEDSPCDYDWDKKLEKWQAKLF